MVRIFSTDSSPPPLVAEIGDWKARWDAAWLLGLGWGRSNTPPGGKDNSTTKGDRYLRWLLVSDCVEKLDC
ncbi:hypothetical protein [Bradyrhizobium sp. AUGA SZCCT0158]|uniref:hypothetical protein n=1 Tax=Bradyrhizobium sp. AUGA SZCCT0158 TaxID=2807661 RepID=UPI001BABA69A|nr:hypothetical protein [Bradyrhizobium sp. AUGA SZCCT0158]